MKKQKTHAIRRSNSLSSKSRASLAPPEELKSYPRNPPVSIAPSRNTHPGKAATFLANRMILLMENWRPRIPSSSQPRKNHPSRPMRSHIVNKAPGQTAITPGVMSHRNFHETATRCSFSFPSRRWHPFAKRCSWVFRSHENTQSATALRSRIGTPHATTRGGYSTKLAVLVFSRVKIVNVRESGEVGEHPLPRLRP